MFRASLIGLILAAASGCWSFDPSESFTRSRDWMARMAARRGGFNSDAMRMEIILVRRPVGDPFLNGELWHEVDEQMVSEERRPVLERNGLRLGATSANVPASFQKLMASDESCVFRRQKTAQEGRDVFVPLGAEKASASLVLQRDGEAQAAEFAPAQFGLQFHMTRTEDRRVRVRITPTVQHGPIGLLPRIMSQQELLTVNTGRPEERFAFAGCELTASPNELLVIGCWPRKENTLGQLCFLHQEGEQMWQHLLFIRVYATHAAEPASPASDISPGQEPLPLAIQSTIMPRRVERGRGE
jgi:hypothetical protein